MKRGGFTMIELIFVIVILGILASVAIPRLTQTAASAKIASAEAFIGTMNRSVAADMWAGIAGDANVTVTGMNIDDFTDLPTGVTITMSLCNSDTNFSNVGGFDTTSLPNAEQIWCRDATSTRPPFFAFDINGSQKTVAQ